MSNTQPDGEIFKQRVYDLASQSIQLDLVEYLNQNNKKLHCALFNFKTKTVVNLFGDTPQEVIDYVLSRPIDSKAGYRVDAHSCIPGTRPHDLLLISEDLLKEDSHVVDMIILHELVHLTVDSDNINIELTEEDRKFGAEFYNSFEMLGDKWHDLVFCENLAGASRIYNENVNLFPTAYDAARCALKFDYFDLEE